MTKQHFAALAAALKAQMPTNDAAMLEQWNNDVIAVTNVCTNFNTAFHKGKFLAACGVPNLLQK